MAVIDVPITSFTPDLPALNNPGSTRIHNATAGRGSTQGGVTLYPLKRASLFSNTFMESRPRGSAIGQDRDGNSRVYSGSEKALYKLAPSTRQWTDISRAGGYTTGGSERWKFQEFGNIQIATNYNDHPQFIDMNVDTQFADLTTLVKGRHIATFRGFLLLGNTYDALDGSVPHRIRWSGIEAPASWAYSQATLADFQDLMGFGAIQAIVTDDSCYVLLQRGIVQMTFIGAPYVFQFTDRVVGKGCSVPSSVVTLSGGRHVFLAEDGFHLLHQGNIQPIGNGLIDRWFNDVFDPSQAHLMTTATDPAKSLVYWSFVSKNSETGRPDMMLCWNTETGDWTTADATTHFIFNSVSLPTTIDQLDSFSSTFDDLETSFDDPIWQGGQSMLWGMSDTGKVYSFGGRTMELSIETPELQLSKLVPNDGQMDVSRIDGVRPLFEGDGTARVQIGTRSLPNGDVSWSDLKETNPQTGFSYVRSQSRFARVRVTIAGDWTKAFALQIDAKAVGRR